MKDWLETSPIQVPASYQSAIGGHPLVATTLLRRGLADVEAAREGAMPAPQDGPVAVIPGTPAGPARAAGEMTLVDHLAELRDRLVKVIVAVALSTVCSPELLLGLKSASPP